jgi:hypothetical protein
LEGLIGKKDCANILLQNNCKPREELGTIIDDNLA